MWFLLKFHPFHTILKPLSAWGLTRLCTHHNGTTMCCFLFHQAWSWEYLLFPAFPSPGGEHVRFFISSLLQWWEHQGRLLPYSESLGLLSLWWLGGLGLTTASRAGTLSQITCPLSLTQGSIRALEFELTLKSTGYCCFNIILCVFISYCCWNQWSQFGGLEQHTFILLQFRGSEVQNGFPPAKIKVQSCTPSGGCKGESISLTSIF